MGNKIQDIISEKGYLVSGVLSFAQIDENDNVVGGFLPVGNISSLTISPSVTKITKKETMSGKNSIVNEVVTDISAGVSLTFQDLTDDNIEMFMFGTTTKTASTTASTIALSAEVGAINPLAGYLIDPSTPVVVQDAGGAGDTYEEGKNYEVQDSDIYIYSTAEQTALGATNLIAQDTLLEVDLDTLAMKRVDAFTETDVKVAMRFTGVNVASGDAPIVIEVHKVSLDPTEFEALSTENFADFSANGTILKAKGRSELFRITQSDA